MKEGCKVSCVEMVFLDYLLGSQYLFEILQTSLFVKNSESVVKSRCFEKSLRWRAQNFLDMKEGYKVSCVKILMFWYITRRSVFI